MRKMHRYMPSAILTWAPQNPNGQLTGAQTRYLSFARFNAGAANEATTPIAFPVACTLRHFRLNVPPLGLDQPTPQPGNISANPTTVTLRGRATIADPPIDLATITIPARPPGTPAASTLGVGSFNADAGDPISVSIPRGYLLNCRIVTNLPGAGERIFISVILAKFQV